ncbi:MAG: phosphoribosylanthranilate isomerase [Pirellulales bacterium]
MFRIKICGITNVDDALAAADAGADAIGLNFFSKSRRFVTLEVARQIAATLPATVTKVGVFVNHSTADIASTVEQVGLDCIQLHGDEPAQVIAELPAAQPVVRAWRSSRADLESLIVYLGLCRLTGRVPDAILMDTATDSYGGAGRVADWNAIAAHRYTFADVPLILAGGLTPENVAHAVVAVRPDGVDVATGVESRPGHKSAALILRFISAACAAFERGSKNGS